MSRLRTRSRPKWDLFETPLGAAQDLFEISCKLGPGGILVEISRVGLAQDPGREPVSSLGRSQSGLKQVLVRFWMSPSRVLSGSRWDPSQVSSRS